MCLSTQLQAYPNGSHNMVVNDIDLVAILQMIN